jgi:hypothetical protein
MVWGSPQIGIMALICCGPAGAAMIISFPYVVYGQQFILLHTDKTPNSYRSYFFIGFYRPQQAR